MGLDNEEERVFNKIMGLQLLLDILGLGPKDGEGDVRIKRISPMTRERIRFEDEAKAQFQALKKKGLSIPVFTL